VAQAKEAKKASADAKSKGKGKGKGKHGGAAGDITGPVAVVTGIFLVLFTAIIMATDLSKDRRERAAREAAARDARKQQYALADLMAFFGFGPAQAPKAGQVRAVLPRPPEREKLAVVGLSCLQGSINRKLQENPKPLRFAVGQAPRPPAGGPLTPRGARRARRAARRAACLRTSRRRRGRRARGGLSWTSSLRTRP